MSRSPDVTVCVRPSALLTPALFLLLTDTPILLAALLPTAMGMALCTAFTALERALGW